MNYTFYWECDCRLWPTMTFMGETTCSKCGRPTISHMSRFLREQLEEGQE